MRGFDVSGLTFRVSGFGSNISCLLYTLDTLSEKHVAVAAPLRVELYHLRRKVELNMKVNFQYYIQATSLCFSGYEPAPLLPHEGFGTFIFWRGREEIYTA